MSTLKTKIVLSRLDGTDWTRKGLRPFLEYRDLGLAEATDGRIGGTIGRAIKKFEPGGGAPRHTHNTSFHLIFVMRGWFRTEFEGLGEVVVRQGDCIAYQGEKANPGWYSKAAETDADPLLFIYQVYDGMVAEMMALKDTHLFITTGLSQVPNERDHYQYRIADFDGFFAKVGLAGATIRPRMSRDFLLEFASADEARAALPVLDTVRCGGKPLFAIEERGETLFCQVAYFGTPGGLRQITIAGAEDDLSAAFVLVSIENAIHQATGYHIDTLAPKQPQPQRIPLADVFDRLCKAALADQARSASLAA